MMKSDLIDGCGRLHTGAVKLQHASLILRILHQVQITFCALIWCQPNDVKAFNAFTDRRMHRSSSRWSFQMRFRVNLYRGGLLRVHGLTNTRSADLARK
jgi:ectoine hydroxylase-related dioxygenase (phytanoyl-CoA dioxygenase family)